MVLALDEFKNTMTTKAREMELIISEILIRSESTWHYSEKLFYHSPVQSQENVEDILKRYAALPTLDARPIAEIIEYDELGLPQ